MPEPSGAAFPRPRERRLPGPRVAPWRRTVRYWVSRLAAAALVRGWLRPHLEGRDRLPPGPAVYCFNHLNWSDPFVLMAPLPMRPRLYFFGPKEEDMARGGRNRLMSWTGSAVPYKPGKNDLLDATRIVQAIFATGGVLAIAGEGRIHARESELLPLSEGPAYFALRSGVPVVPIAINGTSWLGFGGRVRVCVGQAIEAAGRPTHEAITALTARTSHDLLALVGDQPDVPRPGPIGRWMTDRFNDWPGGSGRPGTAERRRPQRAALAYFQAIRAGGAVATSGLSPDPSEYRKRLDAQPDEQIDAWTSELMRDIAIRRGVLRVIADFLTATSLDERQFERVFASGGGPPAVIGRDGQGRLMVPAVTLHALVPGIRSQRPDGRARLIEYLVLNFGELVYV